LKIHWDENGVRHEEEIQKGRDCILPPNSITFVQAEPKFRLPNYMAIRFNLRITHVHRGLLLGTGPLVDPGFEGKLLIPLHNLTESEYRLDTEEALIWVEFTKTSFKSELQQNEDTGPKEGKFIEFEERKKNYTPEQYLHRANKSNAIRSSIPQFMADSERTAKEAAKSAKDAEKSAKDAEKEATRIRNIIVLVSGLGLVVIIAALAGIYFQFLSIVESSVGLTGSVAAEISSMAENSRKNQDRLNAMEKIIRSQSAKIESLQGRIETVNSDPMRFRENEAPDGQGTE
jgi:hypothetical protein